MRKTRAAVYLSVSIAFIFNAIIECRAERLISLPAIDAGWYEDTGKHLPANTNYLAGDNGDPHHNFFVFELSGLNLQQGEQVLSASLTLGTRGVRTSDPSETYVLFDVTTAIDALLDGSAGVSAFADLGSGIAYGSREYTTADSGTIQSIELNQSAVAAIMQSQGSRFAIGGRVTTLDEVRNSESIFGESQAAKSYSLDLLIGVPEPSTYALATIGVIGLLAFRRRTRFTLELLPLRS